MNQQIIKLGTLGSEIELSLMERTFEPIPLPIEEIVEAEDGTEYQYYTDTKNSWNTTFTMLPAKDENTEDLKAGRNSLRTEYNKHTPLSLIIYDEDGNFASYTIRILNYKEIVLRPLAGDSDWRYDISFSLKET